MELRMNCPFDLHPGCMTIANKSTAVCLCLRKGTTSDMTLPFMPLLSWCFCHCPVTKLCPTLCDSMDCSPPGSPVHGISQARILEWVAIPFSRGSSWPRDWTRVSYIADRFFTIWATRGVLKALQVPPNESPDIVEQGQYSLAPLYPNSWPTESISIIIPSLILPLNFGVICYIEISTLYSWS